jgi:alanyl-tRNA synthetase
VDLEEYRRIFDEWVKQTGGEKLMFDFSAVSGELPKTDDSPKYGQLQIDASVVGWVQNNAVVRGGILHPRDNAGLLLDRTNFYAEQGGQVGDEGSIVTPTGRFEVTDTKKLGDAILHVGFVEEGRVESGQAATVTVGGQRPHTMRNHTTTHLLNWALRQVLGDHIEQKGSLVDAEKTRFDFAHDKPLSPEEVAEVERLVNEQIYADLLVTARIMPLAEAKNIPGVRAVFGEKYPDPVRVLLIGVDDPAKATVANSVEFCGGTHLTHTGQAGFFKIVSQEPVSKGVRRVTGVTGRGAVQAVQQLASVVDDLTARFNCKPEDVPKRVEAMQDEIKKLQGQLKKGVAGDLNSAADKLIASATSVNGAKVIVGEMPPAPSEQMRSQMDRIRQIAKSAVVCIGWVEDGKVQLMTAVTDDLTAKIQAGKLVGEVAKAVGGKGGGPPRLAQAGGGNDPSKLADALALAKKLASEKLA